MTKKQLREGILLVLLTIIAGGLTIIIYFGLIHDNPPIVFNDEVLPVVEDTVQAGGTVTIISDQCRYTHSTVTIYREWHNHLVSTEPPYTIGGSNVGCDVDTLQIGVPAELPPGEYHIINRLEYRVNPFAFRWVDIETEVFTVTAADE